MWCPAEAALTAGKAAAGGKGSKKSGGMSALWKKAPPKRKPKAAAKKPAPAPEPEAEPVATAQVRPQYGRSSSSNHSCTNSTSYTQAA